MEVQPPSDSAAPPPEPERTPLPPGGEQPDDDPGEDPGLPPMPPWASAYPLPALEAPPHPWSRIQRCVFWLAILYLASQAGLAGLLVYREQYWLAVAVMGITLVTPAAFLVGLWVARPLQRFLEGDQAWSPPPTDALAPPDRAECNTFGRSF